MDAIPGYKPVYCRRCGAVLFIIADAVLHLSGDITCSRCGQRRRWYRLARHRSRIVDDDSATSGFDSSEQNA
jgi:RNase P subunit RPR2